MPWGDVFLGWKGYNSLLDKISLRSTGRWRLGVGFLCPCDVLSQKDPIGHAQAQDLIQGDEMASLGMGIN